MQAGQGLPLPALVIAPTQTEVFGSDGTLVVLRPPRGAHSKHENARKIEEIRASIVFGGN